MLYMSVTGSPALFRTEETMKESSGEAYQSSQYAKASCISLAKAGKTCFLYAGAMGLLPWQREGAVVDRPEHMHVVTFDANAFGGVRSFVTKACGGNPARAAAALKGTRIYNMQDDFFSISKSPDPYNPTFFNAVLEVLNTVAERASKGGTHVLLISSLTGLAAGVERGVMGAPPSDEKKGYGDIDKWQRFAANLAEVRNAAQVDSWHTLWECHLHEPRTMTQGSGPSTQKETLMVSGKTGLNWNYNVEQVFKIKRMFGEKFAVGGKNTGVDQTFFDTQPTLEFITGGRSTNELLNAKEPCMTAAFRKLGLKVGHWGAPVSKPRAA